MGTETINSTDPPTDRVIVYLGNRQAIEIIDDPLDVDDAAAESRAPRKLRAQIEGKRCTAINLVPGLPLMDAAYEITHLSRGMWQAHSDATGPAWVASTNPQLAQLLAAHWGCELREPDPDHVASGDVAGPDAEV